MFKLKNLMLATAAVAAVAIGSLATPNSAKADVCYGRGGFGGGYGGGYGPVYSRGYNYGYRGGFGPSYRSSFYRGGFGYGGYGYGRSAFYGSRGRGFSLSIGY